MRILLNACGVIFFGGAGYYWCCEHFIGHEAIAMLWVGLAVHNLVDYAICVWRRT